MLKCTHCIGSIYVLCAFYSLLSVVELFYFDYLAVATLLKDLYAVYWPRKLVKKVQKADLILRYAWKKSSNIEHTCIFRLFNESANQSKRLYQRVSESETSSRRDEKTQVPKPSYGPLKVPLTPPASFKLNPTFPSTSTLPRPPIFPSSFFSTSPAKANSVPPRNTAQPTR